MNIIRYKFFFLAFSGILMLVSIGALALWGLKLGVDFTGGSVMEVSYAGARPSGDDIRAALTDAGVGEVHAQLAGERDAILRFRDVDEPTHQKILSLLAKTGDVTERRFDTIGPTIGRELKRRAIIGVALAILVIILYIAWAFRKVSRPVASWKYGVAAFAALIHDVLIPSGFFAFLGHLKGVEVDTLFITALLTILGFSVHDTIVVFDRTRENLRGKDSQSYEEVVNRSLNETLARSLFTSLTVLLVLASIMIFGGASVRYFALALFVGIVFGTYSSIFVASPILVIWEARARKK